MGWFTDLDKGLQIAILTLLGSLFGFLLTRVYDRFFTDKLASKSQLLEKLKNQTLSKTGKLRLREDLQSYILNLTSFFKNPYAEKATSFKIDNSHRYYVKEITKDSIDNSCPANNKNNIFFYYDTGTITQEVIYNLKNVAERIDGDLSNYFKDRETENMVLKSKPIIDDSANLIFWLHAPNFFPQHSTSLTENYNIINSIIKKWIPVSNLVIELYFSNDLVKSVKGLANEIKNLNYSDVKLPNKFSELISIRNTINTHFSEGFELGSLNYIHEPITNKILVTRLGEIKSSGIKDILNIYGSPGTGKTFIVESLIKEYLGQKKGIFLIINNIHLINGLLEKAKINQDRGQFFESIIEIITNGEYNFLPRECTTSNESLVITKFILKNILIDGIQPLYIVIDDYYLYKELIEKVITNILEKKWGINFFIIGRPESWELNEKFPLRCSKYECKNFNRTEALSIIDVWTKKTNSNIESALQIQWLSKENRFSIYLLRLIVNNLENINNYTLSEILRKEIINSISPVYTKLIGVDNKKKISYNELIVAVESLVSQDNNEEDIKSKLRKILDRKSTIDIDTFINRIGELSWASRFQINSSGGSLTTELIEKHLPFLDIELFSTIGSEANIFKSNQGRGSLDWNDSLISDGCLSLLLRRNLQNIINDETKYLEFSGKLEGLRSQNSLNILSLVLDTDAILQLTKIIGYTNFARIDLVDELLTEQNIERLIYENKIQILASVLIESFNKNDNPAFILKVAKIVKKLSDLDDNFKQYLFSMLGLDVFVSQVGQYVLALYYKDNFIEFYKKIDQLGIDKIYSTTISIIVSEDLPYDKLIHRINEIKNKDQLIESHKLLEFWNLYLQRYDFIQSLELLKKIFTLEMFPENEINVELVKYVLKHCKNLRFNANLNDAKQKLNDLLQKSWNKGLYLFSSCLIKILVLFDSPNLVFEEIDWVVNKVDKIALPIRPYGPQKIGEINALLPNKSAFNLPQQNNISAKGTFSSNLMVGAGLEIVSDNFLNDSFHDRQLPVNFRLVNFRNNPILIETATKEDFTNSNVARKFYWRPMYIFK